MRILRLKLVNFIGIQHGMDRDEIEINFPNNGNLIIMLNGSNGSGKSTILSQLHPFKDSFDDRKSWIIPNRDGLKEIDIQNGDDIYKIKHIYKKTASSFISKNGTELNPNGGVRTFNDIVKTELGVDSDYFKIGKIGSNTTSFVSLTASERKQYISKLLPNIDDYIGKFNIVKEKFKQQNNNIKLITSELSKLNDEESLNAELKLINSKIELNEKTVEKIIAELTTLSNEITAHTNNVMQLDPNLDLLIVQAQRELSETIAAGAKFVKTYGQHTLEQLETEIESIQNDLNKVSESIAVSINNSNNLRAKLTEIQNQINKKQISLAEFDNFESEDSLKNKIKTVADQISNLKVKINSNPMLVYTKDQPQQSFITHIKLYSEFMNFIKLNQIDLNRDDVLHESVISVFMKPDVEDFISRLMASSRQAVASKYELLSSKNAELATKTSYLDQVEILKQRPTDCKINSCPFIASALKYSNLENEIALLQRDIEAIKKDITDLEFKADKLKDIQLLYNQFKVLYNSVNPRTNPLYIHSINQYESLQNMVAQIPSDLSSYVDTLITEHAYGIVNNMDELEKSTTELQNLEVKLQMTQAAKKNKELIENDLAEAKTQQTKLNEELQTLFTEYNTILQEQSALSKKLQDFKAHKNGALTAKDLLEKKNNLEVQISNKNKWNQTILDLNSKKNQLSTEMHTIKMQIAEDKKQQANLQNLIFQVQNLKASKLEIENTFNDIKLVKDCLDPNKGIPLYFIKAYLDKTQDIANDLLSIAFNDKFEISFDTTASDFFIKVRTGDYIKNDITEASQGELALTTISISLALIEQAMQKFNILLLDELDGALDHDNRLNFISIIERQAKKLGIEQIFVISHNNAFDLVPSNLILLKGNTVNKADEIFMNKKTILFDVED